MAEQPSRLRRLLAQLNCVDMRLTERLSLTNPERRRHPLLVWAANIGAHAGDSLIWGAVTAILWRRAKTDSARKWTLLGWTFSLIAALLVTLGIKGVVKRRRPGSGRFLYGRGADVHSFPSGHGSRAGIILIWATALHPGFGAWAPLLIAWIGWSRVATGVHYVGDVAVGLLLGVGMGGGLRKIWHKSSSRAATRE